MPKFHMGDAWDAETNAPSCNFVYDFDLYEFYVRDQWQEVLSHAADGTVVSGSIDALVDAWQRFFGSIVSQVHFGHVFMDQRQAVPEVGGFECA